jgi:hypothetical protein
MIAETGSNAALRLKNCIDDRRQFCRFGRAFDTADEFIGALDRECGASRRPHWRGATCLDRAECQFSDSSRTWVAQGVTSRDWSPLVISPECDERAPSVGAISISAYAGVWWSDISRPAKHGLSA